LSVTCDRPVVFSGFSGFLHQYNWPPRFNWNIVESGVKHHKPTKPTNQIIICTVRKKRLFLYFIKVYINHVTNAFLCVCKSTYFIVLIRVLTICSERRGNLDYWVILVRLSLFIIFFFCDYHHQYHGYTRNNYQLTKKSIRNVIRSVSWLIWIMIHPARAYFSLYEE
jgi:hypothetical protein